MTVPARMNNPKAALSLTVQVADEGEVGPAMQALPSDRQRLFVVAMLQQATRDYTAAARSAGYPDDGGGAIRVTAYRLAHDVRVQEAMREEASRMLGAGLGVATTFLTELIADPTKSAKDRLRAVEMLYNRTGLPAQTEHKVVVEHTLSPKEQRSRIEELAARHGLDPKVLLGDIVDGSFEEVSFEEHSVEGLEDLLG